MGHHQVNATAIFTFLEPTKEPYSDINRRLLGVLAYLVGHILSKESRESIEFLFEMTHRITSTIGATTYSFCPKMSRSGVLMSPYLKLIISSLFSVEIFRRMS